MGNKKILRLSNNLDNKIDNIFLSRIDPIIIKKMINLSHTGDVICTKRDWMFSNMLIPGKWKHVAIVHYDGVIEATSKKGVSFTTFEEFFADKNHACLVRAKFLNAIESGIISDNCRKFIGKPYDWFFQPGMDELYCSEMIYHSMHEIKPDNPLKMRKIAGFKTILPSDFYDESLFEIILETV